jgi:hypothetical protein
MSYLTEGVMSTMRIDRRRVLRAECPECFAKRGDRCLGKFGRLRRRPHKRRRGIALVTVVGYREYPDIPRFGAGDFDLDG